MGAGSGTVVYRAWNTAGGFSAAVTLTVSVTLSRTLDGVTGGDDTPAPTDAPAAAGRTVIKAAGATITTYRCRGRWSVAGWCYVLTARAKLQRPIGAGVAGQQVTAARRTITGRSMLLGAAKTTKSGAASITTRLKPPARGATAWLLRTAHTVQLKFGGSAALMPSSAVATTRIR